MNICFNCFSKRLQQLKKNKETLDSVRNALTSNLFYSMYVYLRKEIIIVTIIQFTEESASKDNLNVKKFCQFTSVYTCHLPTIPSAENSC